MPTARLADSQTNDGISLPTAVGEVQTRPGSTAPTLADRVRLVAEGPANSTRSIRRRGILVVDESSFVRDLLRKHLQLKGFRVWTAATGRDALVLCSLQGREIGLILLRHPLPEMEGLAIWKHLRTIEPEAAICFLATERDDHLERALGERGVDCVFCKPLHLEEVTCVVNKRLVQGMTWSQAI
jgi:CheY-like chemotaxis protein